MVIFFHLILSKVPVFPGERAMHVSCSALLQCEADAVSPQGPSCKSGLQS